MADITRLTRLFSGIQRNLDLTQNSLMMQSLKLTTDGGTTSSELTKAILDKLILIQNAADVDGTFDTRYYLKSEIGSTGIGTAGASLVGIENKAYTNFTPAANNVQSALDAIDTALSTAGAVEFDDSTFRVFDDGDNTKKMAFEVAGVSTATTRTLSIQDKDITIAGIDAETFTGITTIQDELKIDGQSYSPINSKGNVSGAVAIDFADGNLQTLTLAGNATLSFSNGKDGGQYLLIIEQDVTGGHDVTFPSDVEFEGPATVINSGSGERTYVSFIYDSSKAGKEYRSFSSNEILSMAQGGTGASLSPIAGGIVYSDADSMEILAPGNDTDVLTYNAGGSTPQWEGTVSSSAGAVDAGKLIRLDAGGQIDGSMIDSSDIDHGSLQGLLDDDHTQYIRVDGTRAFSGNQDMGGNKLTGLAAGTLDSDAIRKDQALLRDGTQAMLADLDMGSFKITNVAAPVSGTDAVNKDYVDGIAAGLDPKESVRYSTDANIASILSASQATVEAALDLVGAVAPSLVSGDRILVKDQTDPKENGIYSFNGTNLVRAEDHDGTPASEVSGGNHTYVENGDKNAGAGFVVIGDGILTLGVDDIVWSQFSGAGQLTGGNGIDVSGNVVSVDLETNSGLEFSSGKLQIDIADATLTKDSSGIYVSTNAINETHLTASVAGDGLTGGNGTALSIDHDGEGLILDSGILKLELDGISLAKSALGLRVNASGITETELSTSVAGDGLSGGGGSALSVNVDDSTIEINLDTLRVKASGITANELNISVAGAGLSGGGGTALSVSTDGSTIQVNGTDQIEVIDDGITKEKINADVAGNGLGQNLDGSLEVNVDDSSIEISADTLQVKALGITDAMLAGSISDGKLAEDYIKTSEVDGTTIEFSGGTLSVIGSETLKKTAIAGESFATAGIYFVRWAKSGETAGRVYKADLDASSNDNFHVIGAVVAAGTEIAGDSVDVIKVGTVVLDGVNDLNFAAGDIGKPVYLRSAGKFDASSSFVADEASVIIGYVQDVDKIEVQRAEIQGVN